MPTFIPQQSGTEVYPPPTADSLWWDIALNQHTSLTTTAGALIKRHGIPNTVLLRTYLGLICLGKCDFEAVETVRTDPFFKSATGRRI